MSWIQKRADGTDQPVMEKEFHRIELKADDTLKVRATDKPVAVWVPSNYEIEISARVDVVLDVAEVVEHHDVKSMEEKLRKMRQEKRAAEQRERRARRRLRRQDRPERPIHP